jgi:hypothetical protein
METGLIIVCLFGVMFAIYRLELILLRIEKLLTKT